MSAKIAYKSIFFILGCVSLILGIIGAVLPLLPTTPFVILSAFCFSKSSKRVHSWLTSLPYFGDAIMDWEKNKVIRPKVKILAVTIILITFTLSITLAKLHIGLKVMLVTIGLSCIAFILTRKSRP